MKNLFVFTFLMTILLFSLYSESSKDGNVTADFALEVGIQNAAFTLYQPGEINPAACLYTQVEVEIELLDIVFLGGSFRTPFVGVDPYEGVPNFKPISIYYGFTGGVRFGGFEIGIRHKCAHPLVTYTSPSKLDDRVLEGGYNEFYFKIETKVSLF